MDNKHISIIIPAYNEENKIKSTIEGIKDINCIDDIIIVDDGSSDNTFKIASSYDNVKTLKLDNNMGKGFALNYGLKIAMQNSDIIGFLDADLGETSRDIEKLIYPVLGDECDVTIAKFPPAKKKGGFGLVKKLAKNGVKMLTGEELDSTLSGQRVFKKEVLQNFEKMPFGYGVEVGMTIDILKKGYKIKEVLVNMTHNETGRDLKGFIHRGKQFYHINITLLKKTLGR
ncbi:MAG: glycosyltransferase family 2 protein [Tepidibacter sp.]|jgi:glycosyltransferase involved in cell wall biosynthesis|uniref:glycosyltransferase family 2 protein n=1 Tax=Tepidibacter sp. TaxID=2529387 RepID=UPI0025E90076|nr:glycosyltransferase family 2 protein [Tepidibacter sp.]MCT4507168.1 glycosyltransferase family 2 protein [Tepidibacter sp.]